MCQKIYNYKRECTMDKISIIIPCYNEQEVLNDFYCKIEEVTNEMEDVEFEYYFVDDGSSDCTYSILKKLKESNDKIRVLRFSRNFGKEAAMYAGFEHINGNYVAVMDADLQDPPSLLKEMYQLIKEKGYDCVGARRTNRVGEPAIRSFFAKIFYKILRQITGMDVVDGARDFRLMKREMVNAVLEVKEYNRFSKGIFAWVGFETKYLEYENIERKKGNTKWNFWKLFKYSIEGIVSFSTVPLFFSSILGFLICISASVWFIRIIIGYFLNGTSGDGFATLVCLLLIWGGVLLFAIGILGIYIARLYLEVKKRPLYIVKEEL